MSKFDEFVATILEGAKDLAKQNFGAFEDKAKADAKDFLMTLEADLKRWTELLAEKKLTERDFSDLVQAKRALAKVHALSQAGIQLTNLERFRAGLVALVIDSAFSVFG